MGLTSQKNTHIPRAASRTYNAAGPPERASPTFAYSLTLRKSLSGIDDVIFQRILDNVSNSIESRFQIVNLTVMSVFFLISD